MHRTILLLALLAICPVGVGPALAQGDGAVTIHEELSKPVEGTMVNPCTGEICTTSGNLHITLHGTITPSGHVTMFTRASCQGTSIDCPSGRCRVTCEQSQHVVGDLEGGTAAHLTTTVRVQFLCPGADNNVRLSQVLRIVVNAKGEATVNFGETTLEACEGG